MDLAFLSSINDINNILMRLLLTPNVGIKTALNLLQNLNPYNQQFIFTNPKKIFPNLRKEQEIQLTTTPLSLSKYIEQHNLWLQKNGHNFIPIFSPDYPSSLFSLYDPPLAIYVKSKHQFLWENNNKISIVGSRKATPLGLKIAHDFSAELTKNNVIVISGLADGVDASAHEGALKYGKTIAIIGTGIDIIYPKKNTKLAQDILEADGYIISEFLLGTQPKPINFPLRNRIIAALCCGVVVVEASLKSGSLITARLANEIGRDVFAVPSSIYSPNSTGCHSLIKEGACLIETVDDILHQINLPIMINNSKKSNSINNISNKKNRSDKQILINNTLEIETEFNNSKLTTTQNKIINLIKINYDGLHIDKIAEQINIGINEIQAEIFILELEEWIIYTDGGYYQFNHNKKNYD